MIMADIYDSEPIFSNDGTVTRPDDEEDIFKSVRLQCIERLSRLVENHVVDINFVHKGGECMLKSLRLARHIRLTQYTPLMIAVIHAEMNVVSWLVDNGANVNMTDGTQRTPLHLAVAVNRPDVVLYLLEKGADVNAQTLSQRTPLLEAVDVNSPLIVDLLITAGANPDLADIKGTTPILDATFSIGRAHRSVHKNRQIVESLIKAGCSVNKANNLHASALMMAVGSKSSDIITILLEAGADINQVDNKKRTPFHIVTEHDKMTNIALQLLQNGADINTKDSAGKTPFEKCVKFGKFELMKFLLYADCLYDKDLIKSERMKYLCDVVPVFGTWLNHEMTTVKSLQRLCRSTIRSSTPTENLTHLQALDLPKSLCNYLMYKS